MVRAGLEYLPMQIQIEAVGRDQAHLAHGPELHRIQENAAISWRADEDGNGHTIASRKQPFRRVVGLFLQAINPAQPVAELRAGHLALKLRQGQAGGDKPVLIEQDALVEGHIRNADRSFRTESAVVGVDWDLVDRVLMVRMQRPVAIVVTDGIRGAEIGHPTCLEEWNQPGTMLRGDSNRAGNGQSNRAAKPDSAIQDVIDTAQISAPKCGQAVLEDLVQITTFVNAPSPHRPALIAGRRLSWR